MSPTFLKTCREQPLKGKQTSGSRALQTEELKKLGEFKQGMTQKLMELYKMTSVDFGKINETLEELTKMVPNMNDKFTKDIES